MAKNKADIARLLLRMPDPFFESGGGGWSFLNACMDRDGHQWGEQPSVEALMCLGMAVGLVTWPMPRGFWPMLPGGVPYFVVLDAACRAALDDGSNT